MKGLTLLSGLLVVLTVNSAEARKAPTQIVYRFDDHRYLELKGWDCQGELWYTDTKRGIHSQPGLQYYQIFTRKFEHPSERYIAIPWWGEVTSAFTVSKDYGQTWSVASMSPGPNEPNGDDAPPYEDAISFTVVNDQGFLLTKKSLYMSSKGFDDPRILPGGPGITYTAPDGTPHTLAPRSPGWSWGMVYMTKRGLAEAAIQYRTEWMNLPDKVPEVKNYQGWDHMRCDMDAGNNMKGLTLLSGLLIVLTVNSAEARKAPTQIVYRFDDHRYLELKGWDCQGELWYTDTNRGIHSQPGLQYYQIFTRKFEHPSERYIAIPWWGEVTSAFTVSKDYGQTWSVASMSPGPNEPNGDNAPPYDDAISFTVINDQGFLLTKKSLYMSSRGFDDPRILPGGPGITYTVEDGTVQMLEPRAPGWAWGMVYMTKRGLEHSTNQFRSEWFNLPDKVPEVKNYQGWDHMRCDMEAGK